METIERRVGNVIVLEMKGQADAPQDYKDFRKIIDSRSEEGLKSFVLNMSECTRLDSMGIGEIVRSLFHVMREGGGLKLACVPQKIKGLLAITNLSQIFETFEDESAAIESFNK